MFFFLLLYISLFFYVFLIFSTWSFPPIHVSVFRKTFHSTEEEVRHFRRGVGVSLQSAINWRTPAESSISCLSLALYGSLLFLYSSISYQVVMSIVLPETLCLYQRGEENVVDVHAGDNAVGSAVASGWTRCSYGVPDLLFLSVGDGRMSVFSEWRIIDERKILAECGKNFEKQNILIYEKRNRTKRDKTKRNYQNVITKQKQRDISKHTASNENIFTDWKKTTPGKKEYTLV